MSQELQVPEPPDPVEQFLLKRVPYAGPLIADLRQLRFDLRMERMADVIAAAVPEEDAQSVIESITSNERISDLFVDAVDSAMASSDERKRRALGRVVLMTAKGVDDATIDEGQLLMAAIRQLEVPHINVMAVLRSPSAFTKENIPVGTPLLASRIHELYPAAGTALDSLLAQLEAWGLIKDVETANRLGFGGSKWVISPYGERAWSFLDPS